MYKPYKRIVCSRFFPFCTHNLASSSIRWDCLQFRRAILSPSMPFVAIRNYATMQIAIETTRYYDESALCVFCGSQGTKKSIEFVYIIRNSITTRNLCAFSCNTYHVCDFFALICNATFLLPAYHISFDVLRSN